MQNTDKIPLISKAYEIDLSKINDGFLCAEKTCYAESISKAKSILLKMVKYEDLTLKYTNEELNYLNIPVKRNKILDKYLFENEELTLSKIEYIKNKRERNKKLDDIIDNDSIKYCYIRKNGMYYGDNWFGYTDYQYKAGIYLKKEAVQHAKSVDEIFLIPIDIDQHNKIINDKIEELQEKIIL